MHTARVSNLRSEDFLGVRNFVVTFFGWKILVRTFCREKEDLFRVTFWAVGPFFWSGFSLIGLFGPGSNNLA